LVAHILLVSGCDNKNFTSGKFADTRTQWQAAKADFRIKNSPAGAGAGIEAQ
jgi:hypothetical protein